MSKIIVAGAGPAGMMAAGTAAEKGNDVILLEKNKRPGRKLYISGKGRCNVTNDTDIEGLIANTPGNGHFLYSSFYNFSNHDLIDFLEERGVPTKVERGNRVFPASDRASDIVDLMIDYVKKSGVKIRTESEIRDINTTSGSNDSAGGKNNESLSRITGVTLKTGEIIDCDAVILATGGLSYPGTGSTGDGYKIAEKAGHRVIEPKPSLVPLTVNEKWVSDLQGVSLKNISLKAKTSGGKMIFEDFGEMLFTHYGVSGPLVLSASRHIADYGYKGIELSIDLKPALSEKTLDARLQRDFLKFSNKQYKNALDDLLPKKMIPVIVMLSGVDPEKQTNQLTKEERKSLLDVLKGLSLTVKGPRPIDEAIVTAGGVDCKQINPSTLESKIVQGLFFAGEIIDVDAYTGGFNLTIAFSTGRLAGASI